MLTTLDLTLSLVVLLLKLELPIVLVVRPCYPTLQAIGIIFRAHLQILVAGENILAYAFSLLDLLVVKLDASAEMPKTATQAEVLMTKALGPEPLVVAWLEANLRALCPLESCLRAEKEARLAIVERCPDGRRCSGGLSIGHMNLDGIESSCGSRSSSHGLVGGLISRRSSVRTRVSATTISDYNILFVIILILFVA